MGTTPTKVTTLPAVALADAAMVTRGGADGGLTLTDTMAIVVSGTVFFTATLKANVVTAVTFGALKTGVAVLAPVRTTPGPPVWVQRKVKGRAGVFGSLLLKALKVTI